MKLFFVFFMLSFGSTCVLKGATISCPKTPNGKIVCKIIYFDRVQNLMWEGEKPKYVKNPDYPANPQAPKKILNKDEEPHDPKYVGIIRGAGSKVLYSGTILQATYKRENGALDAKNKTEPAVEDLPKFGICSRLDWRVVTMAKESSNVLIYGPADVSEFCDFDNQITVVLPVTVIWAELYSSKGNLSDPLRKASGTITAAKDDDDYCGGQGLSNWVPAFEKRKDIRTCDRYSWLRFMYDAPAGPIYNSWTQPGASQATISYVPAIGKVPNTTGGPPGEKAPSETLSFDVQEYPSQMWGYGYIGVPIVFEKANAATANLNSLVFGVSYDVPFAAHHRATFPKGDDPWKLFMRLPDLRIQYGPELAVSTPHDLNLTAALTARVPFGFNVPGRPSLITLFPVGGLEGGNHVVTHAINGQPPESSPVFRKVVGYDASLRAPFIIVHAFLGDKPATIDFSWRTRYLSYGEPLTDYVSGYPERLTKQQRSYWRGSFIVPFSQLAQFKVTVQHGALPPDFDYLGYSVNVGLTLGNPGYTEH